MCQKHHSGFFLRRRLCTLVICQKYHFIKELRISSWHESPK